MNFARMKSDFKYMRLNFFINRIPCWSIRKFLYRLEGITIGKDSRIGIGTIIIHPRNITIGERTIINEFCYLDGRGGLVLGNDVSISIYTMFLTGTHEMNDKDFVFVPGKTIVGNNVWTGAKAIILNDCTIEDGAVIGAGCVFKGRAKENEVYIGNPAQKVKDRNLEQHYAINYKPYFR